MAIMTNDEQPEGWTQIADGLWAQDSEIVRLQSRSGPGNLIVYPQPSTFTPTDLGERIRSVTVKDYTLDQAKQDIEARAQLRTAELDAVDAAVHARAAGDGDKAA